MGYFTNINITNFRNFNSLDLDFSNNTNVFYGKNGAGKTNILEAISLFSKGRGLRKDKLIDIIKKHQDRYLIKSQFCNNNIFYDLVSETNESNGKIIKSLSVNDDKNKEALESIFTTNPFLIFLPETERIFLSSPSSRRNFIDRLIFTHNYNYNKLVNQYNKNILERSKLLNNDFFDLDWLQKIENNISTYGLQIYQLRKEQTDVLIKYLNNFFVEFNIPFNITLEFYDKYYNHKIDDDFFKNHLKENRKIDTLIGGSKIGPHKTDFLFYINNEYLISQLSTGQQKTIILLIFLSQSKYLTKVHNKKPILLLDEVCSHLDEQNRDILLTLIESFDLQTFMTGTSKDLFSFLSTNTNFCNITN